MGTTATTPQRETIVGNAIREISHIATLPEITLKIIQLVEDPKSTAQDLHKVISHDPALCSRILKVVNSSFYGLPGQIGSINRAIVMLGLNAVKNIAIAASLAKLFRGGELTPDFAARDLWMHSMSTAATTKLIADELHFALADEAFLGGLIHDIGIMVEMQADRNKLIEVLSKLGTTPKGVPTQEMLAVEEQIFGANHQHFGAGLCDKWKFPRNFTLVTGHHHNPLEAPPENRTLVSIVYLADRLAIEATTGFRLDLTSTALDPAVLDQLKLTAGQIEGIRKALPDHLKNAEGMFT
jgi:putative nucleotidyltransferase with HDIG domain